MKNILFVLLLFSAYTALNGQSPEVDEHTYQAYLGGKDLSATKTDWKNIVALRKKESDSKPNDKNSKYRLALAQFGLLSATMRDQDEDLFDDYIDQTEDNLEAIIKQYKDWGEPKALLSSVYGLKLAYSPWKGMYLGPKSANLMEKARKQSPSSPLVWKLYGNSKFFTPEMWGGDLKEAIQAYEKAIELYKTDTGSTEFNWFYLDTYAFLGQAYNKNEERSKALATYERALTIEPGFYWVKKVLMPIVISKK